jgi:ABC-2 type transport system ATP-binding protein
MPLLEAVDVTKSWGSRRAVQELSFRVKSGEICGLLGANGAGKTTALLVLAGLVPPEQGRVLLDGSSLHGGPARLRHRIGWLPETPAVYPELSVDGNLRFFGQLFRLPAASLKARAEELLSAFQLQDRRTDRAAALSAGLKRRLSVAVSLLHDPEFLLLDEPTTNLDVGSRERLEGMLRELAQRGKAVVVASHRMEEIERLCHRVIVLREGRTVGSLARGAGLGGGPAGALDQFLERLKDPAPPSVEGGLEGLHRGAE